MFKCELVFEIEEDEWLQKEIELPFVPYPNLHIIFDKDNRIFDHLVIDSVDWEHYKNSFYCQCIMAIGSHSVEVATEELKARGWRREN